MKLTDNNVYSKTVLEFVTIANEYSTFLEQADKPDIKEFIDKAHKLLPLLYFKASLLPELDSKYEDFCQRFITKKDYELIRKKILTKLKQYDSYEEVFDPVHQESEKPVGASISENMADIYQDLKDFLLLYEIGTNEVMYEAIWACKQSFEVYWGQRLTNALRALHFLRYTEEEIKAEGELDVDLETDNNTGKINLDDIDTNDWIITRRQEDFRNEERE
jgi:hypothetical protein